MNVFQLKAILLFTSPLPCPSLCLDIFCCHKTSLNPINSNLVKVAHHRGRPCALSTSRFLVDQCTKENTSKFLLQSKVTSIFEATKPRTLSLIRCISNKPSGLFTVDMQEKRFNVSTNAEGDFLL